MNGPVNQAKLQKEFGQAMKSAQEFQMPAGIAAPSIDASKILSGDAANGDIADLGICKLVFDFLLQLHGRFPLRKKLDCVLRRYWPLTQANLAQPGILLKDMYDRCVERKKDVFHKQTDENEAIIVDELSKVSYFKACQIGTMWTPELDRASRKAIWEHISRIMKVVSIVSKFSRESRNTLNKLADQTLSEQERGSMQKGGFDLASLLTNIQDRVLDNPEMMDSIVTVADQHSEEMKKQGMTKEQMEQF